MTQWVSFDEIKSKVSIEDILNHYGVKLRQRRNELTGLCPFPDHDDTRASFSANTVKNVFQCFSCKKSGNVLDLVAYMEGVEIREAGLLLQGWFQISPETPSDGGLRHAQPRTSNIPTQDLKNAPLTFQLKLDFSHPSVRPNIRLTCRIKSDASPEKLAELNEYVQKTSPVLDIIRNPVAVTIDVQS